MGREPTTKEFADFKSQANEGMGTGDIDAITDAELKEAYKEEKGREPTA